MSVLYGTIKTYKHCLFLVLHIFFVLFIVLVLGARQSAQPLSDRLHQKDIPTTADGVLG